MDENAPTSAESKTAYFDQLKRFSHVTSAGHIAGKPGDDDAFDAREEKQRQLHRNFFRPAKKLDAHGQQEKQPQKQQEHAGQQLLPAKRLNKLQNLTPRRLIAAPQPPSGKVIMGTGPGKPRPKGRLDALLDSREEDVVRETPSVGVEKLRGHKDRDSIVVATGDGPMPLPALQRSLETSSEEASSSPSVNVRAGATTRTQKTKTASGNKKRGRVATSKTRPEVEQIFEGLSFFYIPDNDIAPVRRLRINRAKEFGADWTRDMMTATHIIVEKKLVYKDVEKIWPKGGFGDRAPPKVVNEDYPLDCIQFRAIVDPRQKKYLLDGQIATGTKDKEILLPAAGATDSGLGTKSKAGSLPLKPQHHNKGKWDYVPPRGTPSQGEESSVGSLLTRRATRSAAGTNSQPLVLDLDNADELMKSLPTANAGSKAPEKKDDELSEYISIMQEFKDLPLDVDEDDDAQSTVTGSEHQADLEEGSGSENERPSKRRSSRRVRPTNKAIAFEDRFACNRAGRKDAGEDNPNARTIEMLQKMNSYYERVNDHWRTLAYRKAISTLKQQTVKITTEEEAYRLPSIGRRLAQKIEEIVTTDKLKRLEYAEEEPTDSALQTFLKIYGVGIKVAQQWIAQGWRTLDDIKQHVKLTSSQMVGVEHYDDLNTRIPRKEVTALGEVVKRAAAKMDPTVRLIIGGSYRRGAESSHDIDFIVTKPGTESVADLKVFLDSLVAQLERDEFLVARLASSRAGSDGSKWHGCCVLPRIKGLNDDEKYRPIWRRIDFLLVPEVELGAALIYFTGNDIFNRSMRLLASKKGMRLNQRGLYRDVLRGPDRVKVTEGELVERRDERRIFEILGVKWREPCQRWC